MALIGPILDNRTQRELRDELVRRIPAYTKQWTDHNESDPGIALLELFAHLGESLLYRFNQIPETTRIEFLRLLGVQPRPARAAEVLLAAGTEQPAGVQVLRDSEASAGSVSFQTSDEVYVWPLEAVGAGKTETTDGAEDSKADAREQAGVRNAADAAFYRTVLTAPDPASPDAAAIDVSEQLDRALWIAVLAKETTDVSALAGRTLFLGIAFDEALDPPPAIATLRADEAKTFRASVLAEAPPATSWQLWSGPPGSGAETPLVPLSVVGDTTHGMTTTGVVKLELPTLPRLRGPGDGGTDSPPLIDDEETAARVIAWLRVSRPQAQNIGDSIRRVRWVGANCVRAAQSRTPVPESLGTGTGDANQRLRLAHSPVVRGSVKVQVEEPQGWTDWEEVETFARSGLSDRHFMVDHEDGAVVFGRTLVPQIGERIRVPSYRYSAGKAGNVAAGTVTSFPRHPAVEVTNPFPARGGADTADLREALGAIPGEVHRRDRAVTPEDFAALAKEVTGVARVDVLPLFQPDTPTERAAGVTSVIVVPDLDVRNPAAPLPDIALLREVAAHLQPRRLVTSEVYVIPPEYVPVTIAVGVKVRDGYQVDAVRRWVETIVRQYLSPVPPNGPDGEGWPLARAVRAAELEAVAVQVEGVEYAEGARLGQVTPARGSAARTVTERDVVALEKWQLPELVAIEVVRGEPPFPGMPQPGAQPDRTPVPLPPEVC
ncbi:putative baseplate assembly protein [Demequina mangrovi]|uniref:Putative baseplate assembly protein n=1 Tax=Demequina mangrovi TaxID=1043493 RepID=A0A1H6TR36_9MICO|nr:putative baseplate assembly protein [Demequina mangrovi]SEI82523.1 putative baseplate assembly protein [Demequina mangrovi]